ncbi:hypothetical protein M3Y95_00018400 [Aphelenchoides besseyi]|nr:hypothetical protein M3Y95_00018400 [Aphelenchoides besseyi]
MNIQANRIHRQVWPTQVGGFLVSIGFVTGLANMAFFPSAICTQGQAGNFVAVYCICVVLIGFPLTYLHLCLGQYSGCNPTTAFGKLCPAFKGIGWCWLLLTIPMMIISNMNTAWSLYYMFLSGRSLFTNTDLPWSFQENIRFHNREISASLIEFYKLARENTTESAPISIRGPPDFRPTTPDYYHHLYHTAAPEMVMSIDGDIVRVVDKKIILGPMNKSIVTVLALAWLIVVLCTIHNSVHTMNRIVYVTATLPLLILAILFARVSCLPGAYKGIMLLYPDVQRISEQTVWQNAIKLVFFDMQIGVGVLISISKHNRFHTNVFRDAALMVLIDVVVSLAAACVAFGFLGFLAYNMDTDDIRSMCRGQIAPHLLWDQILRSMTYMRNNEGPVFCFLYQLMLGLGAIECSFTMCEYFASALDYKIPLLRNRPCSLRALVAVIMFLLTLPCCFQSGVHIYNLLVYYSMHWNLKIIALCQFAVITYFYGVENLLADIRVMLRLPVAECPGIVGRILGPTGYYIRYAWTWLSPLTIVIALALDLFARQEIKRAKKVGDSTLWHFLSVISIIPLPVIVLYYIYNKDRSAFKPIKWRNLQVPYDDSTISNTFLPQEVDQELYQKTERVATNSDAQKPSCSETAKFVSQIHNYKSVNFVLNTSPYFRIPNPTTTLLSQHTEKEDETVKQIDKIDHMDSSESEDFESDVDEIPSTQMITNLTVSTDRIRTESLDRITIDLTSLTGQPGFFNPKSTPIKSIQNCNVNEITQTR